MSTTILEMPFFSPFAQFTLDEEGADELLESDALLDDMEEEDFDELEEFADEADDDEEGDEEDE